MNEIIRINNWWCVYVYRKYSMTTTVTKSGELRSRPLYINSNTNSPSGNIEIAFFCRNDSSTFDEISCNKQVNLAFQTSNQFLSVNGPAAIVKDPTKIKELWSESYRVWFPQGKDDPSLLLARVDVKEAEYWDQSGISGLKYGFGVLKALAEGQRVDEVSEVTSDPAVHGKLNVQSRV